MTEATTVRDGTSSLSSVDFKFICEFVYDSTGIVLNEGKREMLYRRFARIIRERKLTQFSQYCDLLRKQPEKEHDYFINAITTNLTSFFRENHHFNYMLSHELPKIIDSAGNAENRLRIWSSASSTGEEPYSLAITVHQAMKHCLANWDAKILATDIDSDVLSKAKQGVYQQRKIEDVPKEIQRKYFQKGTGQNANKVRVIQTLRDLITFKQLNLLHEWPMKGPFDIIFCRNVLIYFDKKTQHDLFERYYELLKPDGLLMLGHSENLGDFQPYFENVGRTIFRKI